MNLGFASLYLISGKAWCYSLSRVQSRKGGICIQRGLDRALPPSDTMGYSQRAGGTHPTGMHSCFWGNFTSWAEPIRLLNYLRIRGGAPGTRAPFSVQFLSFSCSFRQNSCQITGFCSKLRGWHPCPGWEILDPPLLTNIFAPTECCVLLPPILHRSPSVGSRIFLGRGATPKVR